LDRAVLDRTNTIGLFETPFRLLHLGVPLPPHDLALLRDIAKWRNEIVHHVPTYPHEEARAKLQRMFDLILRFSRDELGLDLKTLVPKRHYAMANGLLAEWASVVAKAQVHAASSGLRVLEFPCPDCDAPKVVTTT